MLELSIALVIIAGIAGWLVNKWLDQTSTLNTAAAEAALTELLEERLKAFDGRINDTWTVIASTKQELQAVKLQLGFKKGLEK